MPPGGILKSHQGAVTHIQGSSLLLGAGDHSPCQPSKQSFGNPGAMRVVRVAMWFSVYRSHMLPHRGSTSSLHGGGIM
jgi:hypothetical protein